MIRLENVNKIYKMGNIEVSALIDINMFIEPGEYLSIMGPSGSGKSTLMNILGSLDKPTSGRYELDDVDMGKLDDNRMAEIRNKRIGFVFQTFNLLPRLTALENVEVPLLYGKSARPKEKAIRSLKLVGLGDRMHHRPSQLSGGQRQRVAIARALVMTPSIILADEPTGNLDSRTGDDILNLFNNLNKETGVSLIVVTHEKNVALKSSRIITILDGRIKSDEKL